ncbi:MAG: hypothetical protein JWP28_1921 [Phenylobacterium sp.]|jgi:hypothetical protein|uniref:DUF2784 domain-containing protein n=1 Tax=Phenylobacterium sp. TaxID=1871053 RepID=UPI00262CD5FF|nr:DUF2784 domain-containing protein [Phenylobacterium sp.]MDB5450730.1 hypothetical protein [Phenylobacterium sp.]MDB5497890.1 hypothetical protein [Phenylobacterium sp.]
MNPALAQTVLAAHLAIIAFNVFGLVAIPLGAWRGWAWVRVRWWRALHLASMAVVALQAVLGRACFLTLWQDQLTGARAEPPLIMRWVNGVIYWPLPIWVFAAAYLAVFAYVVVLWRRVPPSGR